MISRNRTPHVVAILSLALFIVLSLACGSTEPSGQIASLSNGNQGTAPVQALTGADTSKTRNPYFTGNGGSGMRLGILVPQSQGLNENQAYLPAMVQGVLVSNMSKYSAISVLDRVSLNRVIVETPDLT